MKITDIPAEGYERIVHGEDAESGLNAIIAVHDTTLGPSCGGTRLLPYATEEDALFDVKRLARGMTYKSALARTGLGGGKAVVIADPKAKTEALLLAMGRLVDSLGGLYITAEDMNMGVPDLEVVRRETRWVAGLTREAGSGGNPSPYTARGVLVGIKASAREAFGDDSLSGRRIAVQGIGAVGSRLAVMCLEEGAEVVVEDIDSEKSRRFAKEHGVEALADREAFLRCECDIIAPCARGALLNDDTIPELKCKVIAGAANNQLLEPRHGVAIRERGILYAPDYVVNAGGIINIGVELRSGGYEEAESLRQIDRIGETLAEIFAISKSEGICTASAADRLAERILAEGRAAKPSV